MILVPFLLLIPVVPHAPLVALTFLALPLAMAPVRRVIEQRAGGRDLIPVLTATGKLELVASLLMLAGFALSTMLF